jgi:23S rRNA pseudouridine955/2504/2580 synthase
MLERLYENENILVIDKPAGLAVQPGAGVTSCVIGLLEAELPAKPYLVHRLDKDTAGLLVVAKNRDAAVRYGDLIAGRKLDKTYLAVCSGSFPEKRGSLSTAVTQHGREKSAKTDFAVLREFSRFSLLELALITGRMHQIRVQLSAEGRPILGDDKYGDFSLNRNLAREQGLKGLLLLAWRLWIPEDGGVVLTAPLPAHFTEFLSRFDIEESDFVSASASAIGSEPGTAGAATGTDESGGVSGRSGSSPASGARKGGWITRRRTQGKGRP